jgi:hypothetical protein
VAAPNTDLDLTLVNTDDLEKLSSKINNFYTSDSTVKAQLSWHWERNQMMLDGKQWIVFDGERETGGVWKKLRVSKNNEYIPRPVTNYLFSSYQTLKSYLIKNKPRSTVRPTDALNWRDKVSAKIATLVLEANWAKLKEQYNYEVAAASLVTYGTVFKKSYWDTSSRNLVKVPRMIQVPMTDPMTGAVVGMSEQQDVDPITREPAFDELPLGDLSTSVIDPFRMCIDPLAMSLHDARWVMEYSIQPLEWIHETFGKEGEGFTGLALEVEADTELNGSMRRWFQLKTTSGTKNNGPVGSGSADTMVENSAVVKEYYEQPSSKNPKGRLIVVAGDKVVFAGPSPYEGPEQGDWHPYSECRWELVPGRFWGKSPLDDAAEIQKQINSIDSVITLVRKVSAVPQWLIPNASGVAPGSMTGRPGQQHFYRPDPSGAKPEPIQLPGVDQSVFAERAQRVSDLKEITGATDILRGDKPPGADAASAMNLLYEIGTGRIWPVLDRWKCMVESDQKKQLRIIQKFYKEPRPDFIRYLKSLNTDLSEMEINQFIGTDLNDNCNVVVEAGSNIPKLQAAKQSLLMELAQMGMLNLQAPSNRVQFQQDMGITGYDSDIEPDRKRAQWENDLIDNIQYSPDNKPVVLVVDNHDLHIEIHQNRMKAPNFMALSSEVQQAYMMHIQQHEQFKAQAMQAQMLQDQAMGAAPGSTQPQGAQGAGVQSGHGTGVTKEVKNALMGDTLTPASLGHGSR